MESLALSLIYMKAHKRFYYTLPRYPLRFFLTHLSLTLSEKQRSTYHRMTGLCPVFLSCFFAWQHSPILLSLHSLTPLFITIDLQNFQYTYCHHGHRIDGAMVKPPLFWCQPKFTHNLDFRDICLKGILLTVYHISSIKAWSICAC